MKVTVNGHTYRVRFQRITTCRIEEVGMRTASGSNVVEAQTKCHALDEPYYENRPGPAFDVEKGEREALKLALAQLSGDKEERKQFWRKFLKRWDYKVEPEKTSAELLYGQLTKAQRAAFHKVAEAFEAMLVQAQPVLEEESVRKVIAEAVKGAC